MPIDNGDSVAPKIAVVFGTRPEVIKLSKVVEELRQREVKPILIHTGQHTDLLRGTPFEDGMAPDVNLQRPGTNDPIHYAGLINAVLRDQWTRAKPELVIVQGDTASAYAGALAAEYLGIDTVHVEAGIRSGDREDPWPEEAFRIAIDEIAYWKFAATSQNAGNCSHDPSTHVLVTGNPGIDALYGHTRPVEQCQKVDRILITLHRRESFGEPLRQIVSGIHRAAQQQPRLEFVWPLHPNPRVAEALEPQLVNSHEMYMRPDNLLVIAPLDTVAFAKQLARSRAVITDSGGVSEESAALGVACVVARNLTDRPESVALGLARVAGKTEQGILETLQWALDTRCEPSHCFGDGHAAPRIVEHLLA